MKISREDISTNKLIYNIDPQAKLKEASENRKKQEEVEEYNKNLSVIDPIFDNKEIINRYIIVRLKKDDYIVERDLETKLLGKVEIKKSNKIFIQSEGGKATLVDTPLPYLPEGVIVAYDKSLDGVYPQIKVGAYVELANFDLENKLYYPDKTKFDDRIEINEIIAGANPYKNFEGYVKISAPIIEAFIKVPEGESKEVNK